MDYSYGLLWRMRPPVRRPLGDIPPLVVHDMSRLNAITTQQTSPLHNFTVSFDKLAHSQPRTAWAGIHGLAETRSKRSTGLRGDCNMLKTVPGGGISAVYSHEHARAVCLYIDNLSSRGRIGVETHDDHPSHTGRDDGNSHCTDQAA
jgi:hypothetical protein